MPTAILVLCRHHASEIVKASDVASRTWLCMVLSVRCGSFSLTTLTPSACSRAVMPLSEWSIWVLDVHAMGYSLAAASGLGSKHATHSVTNAGCPVLS